MLSTLILAAAMAGQWGCATGSCGSTSYGYAPTYGYAPAPAPFAPAPAPFAPAPAPFAPAPAPSPAPRPLRPVPPSPYKAAAAPTADLDRKIDALAEQVKALAAKQGVGSCACGVICPCGGRITPVTAFRFQ